MTATAPAAPLVAAATASPAAASPRPGGEALPAVAWIGTHGLVPPTLAGQPGFVRHPDSDDFLLTPGALDARLCIVELALGGVPGLELLGLLSRRSEARLLALAGDAAAAYVDALDAGADLVLALDAPPEHLLAAVRALRRRAAGPVAGGAAWRLHPGRRCLVGPDGATIALSDAELEVMRCFAEHPQHRATRAELVARLWGEGAEAMDGALQATIYRLRKRLEQAGARRAPVQALSRLGYEFRAPLLLG